jgi:hypothetical protein
LCPGYNTLLSEQLQKYHGALTPEVAIRYVTAFEQSGRRFRIRLLLLLLLLLLRSSSYLVGDNHIAFYDLTNMKFWISFAAPHDVAGPSQAYKRQFVKYDAWALLNEKP